MSVADMVINRCRTADTPRNARQLRRPAAAIPAAAKSCCVESIIEWKIRCGGHLATASSTVMYRVTDRHAASGNNNSGWAFSGGVPMGNNSNGGFPTQNRQLGGGVSFAQSLGGSQQAAPLDLSYVLSILPSHCLHHRRRGNDRVVSSVDIVFLSLRSIIAKAYDISW